MGSDVGQIFPTASLHRDHSISYALVCEKEISHMSKNNGNLILVCEESLIYHSPFSLGHCGCFYDSKIMKFNCHMNDII